MTERGPSSGTKPTGDGAPAALAPAGEGLAGAASAAGADAVRILGLTASERAAWERLFGAYAAFYEVEQDPAERAIVWAWLMEPAHPVQGLGAFDQAGRLVGFVHFRPVPDTLGAIDSGYVDDLFVDPDSRGRGIARALLQAVASIGRAKGWSTIRWQTADTNDRARGLYDQIAARTRFLTYKMSV